MRISHEAIYEALYIRAEVRYAASSSACLRTGRALRVPRSRTRGRGKKFVTPEIMISERPAEADDRAVPGHWEGDLILGLHSSAIGTLVERTTRFTMLLHLPRMNGHGEEPRVKNGPALAGHGAEAVRDAIAATITTLPEQLRRSLTWDQGAEMAHHTQLRIHTGLADLLLRSPQPMAARHEREHQRSATPILPKGHRPARDTAATSSKQSLLLSTADPARRSAGEHPPKPSTIIYAPRNTAALRRLVEPGQYTSWAFGRRLRAAGLLGSMGTVGDAYDNAVAESFFATLQLELLDRHHWQTGRQLASAIFEWIEAFYNPRRRHSTVGMLSPVDYETTNAA